MQTAMPMQGAMPMPGSDPCELPVGGNSGLTWDQSSGTWMTPQGLPQAGTSVREPFVTNSFFRLEYLSNSIKNPGPKLLGAPVAGVNVAEPFQAVDSLFNIVTAEVLDLNSINLYPVAGMRTTFGWEFLNGGSVEFSAFLLENAIDRVGSEDTLPEGQVYATSLLINGQISDGSNAPNLLFYNSFYARYSSRLWGSEINWIGDPGNLNIFELRPLAGVRYVNLYEKLQQRGTYTPPFFLGDPLQSSIDTWTYNNVVVPQIGFRLEAVTKYLTFGVEPKFGMGPNLAMAKVQTDHLRSVSDGTIISHDHTLRMTTLLDLNGYVRAHVNDHLTLSLGYNMTYLSTVIRAADATYYNDSGDLAQTPGVEAQAVKSDILWRGLTVGGELRW